MKVYTRVQLENKSMKVKQLLEIYNSLSGKKAIKSFRSKNAGIERILDAQKNEPIVEAKAGKAKAAKAEYQKPAQTEQMFVPDHIKNLILNNKKLTNEEFSKLSKFKKYCEGAETPVTVRQASKFRNFRGLAFRFAS